jgi:hypothetical protein
MTAYVDTIRIARGTWRKISDGVVLSMRQVNEGPGVLRLMATATDVMPTTLSGSIPFSPVSGEYNTVMVEDAFPHLGSGTPCYMWGYADQMDVSVSVSHA